MLKNEHAPRILISQPGDVRDCVLTLPLLNAVRRQFPSAWIAWAASQDARPLLESHESLDEVVPVPEFNVVRMIWSWGLRRRLRPMNFDMAVDAQGSALSAFVARASGAHQRLGLQRPNASRIAAALNNEQVTTRADHPIDQRLELLRPLGIVEPAVEFQVPAVNDATQRVEQFIREAHLGGGFATLHWGSHWSSMLWSPAHFRMLTRSLNDSLGLSTVVTWDSADDGDWVERIVGECRGSAVQSPPTGPLELAALLRASHLCIACDAHAIHLSAAVDTPCVALNSESDSEFHSPRGDRHVVLGRHLGILGPSATNVSVWRGISPERVFGACEKLLQQTAAGQADAA